MTTALKTFTTSDPTLSRDLTVEGEAWVANCNRAQTFRLFEVSGPGVEDCTVFYLAKLKTEGLTGRAYLEMWCRLPGRGEFFSKGIMNTVTGTNDWVSCEIPFFLKKGQKPDLIRLNLIVEAVGKLFWKKPVAGRIWVKEVALLRADPVAQ